MMVAKSGSLSLKQPVKVYPIYFSQGVSFDFVWEAKGKAHCDPFRCLPAVAHLLFVSTRVTKSSGPMAPGYQRAASSRNPTMPLGRKTALTCLLAGRQSRVEKIYQLPEGPCAYDIISDLDVSRRSAGTKKGREKKGVWELHVYMCFELCLIHNWKAIHLQRPQKYFYNTNKCTLVVGLFQMAQTRSPQRWDAVLIGASGGAGGKFLSSLVMTSYWKGSGQPETGAGVGEICGQAELKLALA